MKLGLPYRDRSEAGRILAEKLADYGARTDLVVLGLTKGGVPVAAAVAGALGAPLDVVVVAKLGAPAQPELEIGAIAADGVRVLDEDLIRALSLPPVAVDGIARRELADLERCERFYRSRHAALDLRERTVILVDDGVATQLSMLAALRFVRKQAPRQVVLAAPVAAARALELSRHEVDDCVCPAVPEPFFSVASWYWNFPLITDAEVTRLFEMRR
jgi:putative phosphoribosyl transferase